MTAPKPPEDHDDCDHWFGHCKHDKPPAPPAPKPPEGPLWCDPTEPHPLRHGCFRLMHNAELAALRAQLAEALSEVVALREGMVSARSQLAQAKAHNDLLRKVAEEAVWMRDNGGDSRPILQDCIEAARAAGAL